MSADFQPIVEAKEAERRRLRELPWLEKLELVEKLRDRQLILRQTRVREPEAQRAEENLDPSRRNKDNDFLGST
ncbi:MAG TPA: hypothetical protein VGI85_07610 [Chthoniobacterales bacterium]|jgi:hypothetical protein